MSLLVARSAARLLTAVTTVALIASPFSGAHASGTAPSHTTSATARAALMTARGIPVALVAHISQDTSGGNGLLPCGDQYVPGRPTDSLRLGDVGGATAVYRHGNQYKAVWWTQVFVFASPSAAQDAGKRLIAAERKCPSSYDEPMLNGATWKVRRAVSLPESLGAWTGYRTVDRLTGALNTPMRAVRTYLVRGNVMVAVTARADTPRREMTAQQKHHQDATVRSLAQSATDALDSAPPASATTPHATIAFTRTSAPASQAFTYRIDVSGLVRQQLSLDYLPSLSSNQFQFGTVTLDGKMIFGGESGQTRCNLDGPLVPSAINYAPPAATHVTQGLHHVTVSVADCGGFKLERKFTFTVA